MYLDVVKFTPTAGGTTDFVVSAAVTGYQTPTAAGAKDSAPYYYRAESADLAQWEVGMGTWTAGSTTLARTTVLFNSSGTTAKINFTIAPQVGLVALAEGLRETLTANRTYFVNPSTGSDSNAGLTSSTAFATIQKAYDTIAQTLDLGGRTVTISCSNTTYTAGLSISQPWAGGGALTLDIGGGIINVTSFHDIHITCPLPGIFTIQNGTFQTTTGGNAINHLGTGIVGIGSNVAFGATVGAHMQSGSGAQIILNANYTVSGGATYHMLSFGAGAVIKNGTPITVTVSGTPAISFFAYSSRLAFIDIEATTYSGSATGTRYNVDTNAVIYTGGGGANFFPGSVAGSASLGGVYA